MDIKRLISRLINRLFPAPAPANIIEKRIVNAEIHQVSQPQLLAGRRALVIGGGTGIGKAIADYFVECGSEVIVASRVNRGEHKFFAWDVTNTNEIRQQFCDCVNLYGDIDIVVNAQGICPDDDFCGRWEDVTVSDYDSVMDVNSKSVFFVCQSAIQYFRDKKIAGNILNIASTEGLKGCIVPYGISKAAVISMTKGFGKMAASYGIVVNGIAPGATATQMMRIQDNNISYKYIPSKRMTMPEEIANVAVMLVSNLGKNMCGEIVCVDGGESLK